jgi:hypothetical protein
MSYSFEPDWTKTIVLPTGQKLGHLPKDPNIFLDRSTIYYGASGTGKSVAIREQLKLLEGLINSVIVYAPTNKVNNTYTGIVDDCVIHPKLTRESVERVFAEQEKLATIYTEINNPVILEEVVRLMLDIPMLSSVYYRTVNRVETLNNKLIEKTKIIKSSNISFPEAREKIGEFSDLVKNKIIELYKTAIRENRQCLLENINDPLYTSIIKKIDMNPRLLIVMDDCIDDIVAISGKSKKDKSGDSKPSIMDTIFSRGRWAYITIIIAAQDDVKVTAAIRKNTYISIFTDSECAQHFMESKANAIIAQKRKYANIVINAVFNDGQLKRNDKKLVYYRLGSLDKNMFTYKIADIYESIDIGSPAFKLACAKISNRQPTKKEVLRQLLVPNSTNN